MIATKENSTEVINIIEDKLMNISLTNILSNIKPMENKKIATITITRILPNKENPSPELILSCPEVVTKKLNVSVALSPLSVQVIEFLYLPISHALDLTKE